MSNTIQFWKREGFVYVARIYVNTPTAHGTITRTLDFVSYHLIRLFHGEKKLMEMAAEFNPDKYYE